ncbi:M23 family metallopeptidase [Rubrivirga sp. IMCC45206]|uniref:M23 family metallopeptidase n=1 Tax=Rubrivirga sp. IMCC45206 TaxID=3391614 RepID=UPI00398FCD10
MKDLLRDLFAHPGVTRTVIVLEPDTMSTPRQYEVRPGNALYAGVIAVVGLGALLVAAIVLTPLRGLILGPGTGELRGVAETNASRAEALEDSLALQYQQIAQLRALITGEMDALADADLDPSTFSLPEPSDAPASSASPPASDDHAQPALPIETLGPAVGGGDTPAARAYLASLRLPALPPVDGVESRGFDASRGHFALDLAARTGSPVRAFADGHVVFADWTQDGGLTVAVQHADGYLSVYKHNGRLLRRVGDRVGARETIALSGDTGEITSGPHLHFEVWRDGLAQDPAALLVSL